MHLFLCNICISYLSVLNLINSVPVNIYNAHVYANQFVCDGDQLESLSYFGHCAHFLFTTSVIYFAYVFIFLVMYLYVVIIICK